MLLDLFYNVTLKTGWVIVPLFLTGCVGWYILIHMFLFLRNQKVTESTIKKKKFLKAIDKFDTAYILEHSSEIKSSVVSGFFLFSMF